MSIAVVALVLKRKLGSTARKIIAIKLADVAGDEGEKIYPSVKTIAAETEVSERTVQYILKEFVAEKLLTVVHNGGTDRSGRRYATEYLMNISVLNAFPLAQQKRVANTGADSAPGLSSELSTRVQPATLPGANPAPPPVQGLHPIHPDEPSDDPDARATPAPRSFDRRTLEVRKRSTPAQLPRFVSEDALDKVRKIAPNWDRQMLLKKFLEWSGSASARDMDAAFLGWAKKFTKGKSA